MDKNKAATFALTICAVVIGFAFFKQIDIANKRVEKLGLSIIYILTLIFIGYVLVRSRRRK